MKKFLIDGLSYNDYQSFCNESGRENVIKLLDTLEVINYVLEFPMESTYWLTFINARYDGVHPDMWKFPSLIDKYFPMSFKEFLTTSCDETVFKDFENECLQSCASLDHEQVYSSHNEILYLYSLTKK